MYCSLLPYKRPPEVPVQNFVPQTLVGTEFLPGYLKTLIGRRLRIEFLIGTNGPLLDRTGTLVSVGANYILYRLGETDDLQTADLYSIKFVTVYR